MQRKTKLQSIGQLSPFNLQNIVTYNNQIFLSGVNTTGASVSLRIPFSPRILVKGEDAKQVEEKYGVEPVAETRKPFIGYSEEKEKVFKITFDSVKDYYRFRDDDLLPISVHNQVLHAANLRFNSWVEVTHYTSGGPMQTIHKGMTQLSALRPIELDSPPKLLKMFMEVEAFSRDGLLTDQPFAPDAKRPLDKIFTVRLLFAWTDNSGEPWEETVSVFNDDCQTERDVLSKVRDLIVNYDPDIILHYGDVRDTVSYFLQRAEIVCPRARAVERIGPLRGSLRTRGLLDIRGQIQKHNAKPEAYDLDYAYETFVPNGDTRLSRLHKIVALENQLKIVAFFLELSNLTDTDFTRLSGGEQNRIYNLLSRELEKLGYYLNMENSDRLFKTSHPPTIARDQEHPDITANRNKATQEYKQKQKTNPQQSLLRPAVKGSVGATHEPELKVEVRESFGGQVMLPVPMFSVDVLGAILDFMSLYPSIMMSWCICFSTIVVESKWLNHPDAVHVQINNRGHTIAVIQKQDAVLPSILNELLEKRRSVKRQMAEAKDRNMIAILNHRQLAIKVTCNAIYGFTGASAAISKIPMPSIMYVVTALGRYLLTKTANWCADNGFIVAYGDTDSVFIIPKHPIDGDPVAYFTAIAKKITLYLKRPYIILEFENTFTHPWFTTRKKYYCCLIPEENNKCKITGMPEIKRGWCRWVRDVLRQVRICIQQSQDPLPVITHQIDLLVRGQVPKKDLLISKSVNEKYTNDRQPHISVIRAVEKAQRCHLRPGDRISFWIEEGAGPIYKRAVHAKHPNPKIDYRYYLEHQLMGPLKVLLSHQPSLREAAVKLITIQAMRVGRGIKRPLHLI